MGILNYLKSKTIYETEPIYNLNWIANKSQYKKFLKNLLITVVDVGARAGSAGELKPLEDFISYIGFDADKDEVERLNNLKTQYHKSKFIPCFVSSKKESINFNLHHDGGNSSVYLYSDEFLKWFKTEPKDYIKEKITLEADSLDNSINDDVDFIKLDTQGNEFYILKGAKKTLEKTLMLEIEVEFFEMYKDQKMAHDVMKVMFDNGFDLLFLNRVQNSSKYFNGESRGQLIFGDMLFGISREKALMLNVKKQLKYCVLLINYGLIDFAYDIYLNSDDLKKESPELGKYFMSINKKSLLTKFINTTLDKIIFTLLNLRKTNGLRSDSDRSWPTR